MKKKLLQKYEKKFTHQKKIVKKVIFFAKFAKTQYFFVSLQL